MGDGVEKVAQLLKIYLETMRLEHVNQNALIKTHLLIQSLPIDIVLQFAQMLLLVMVVL